MDVLFMIVTLFASMDRDTEHRRLKRVCDS